MDELIEDAGNAALKAADELGPVGNADSYEQFEVNRARAAGRAFLTALQSKGWVVVPVEPTEEMVLAADRMGFRAPRNFWNEMLLASPMNDLLRAQTRSTKADRSAG